MGFRSRCCASCSRVDNKVKNDTCDADNTDQLKTDTGGSMPTCDWGVQQGYCSKDPEWATSENWFVNLCCKSCANRRRQRRLQNVAEQLNKNKPSAQASPGSTSASTSSNPSKMKVPVANPQRPFQRVELHGDKFLNTIANRYREMVIPGAVSKFKNTSTPEDPLDDPLEVVYFNVFMGSTEGWKEALLKCGWIDP